MIDDEETVPLFGPPDDQDEPKPVRRHDLPRCRNCLESLRDDAVWCDRCGAKQDVPRHVREKRASGVPWHATLAIGLLLGLLCGGAVIVWLLAERVERAEQAIEDAERFRASLDAVSAQAAEASRIARAAAERNEPSHETVRAPAVDHVPAPAEAESHVTLPPDTSPAGLRARFGKSVLEIVAFDEQGELLDRAPCFACAPRRAVTVLSLLAGASAAILVDSTGAERTITGVVAHDAAFDLVVVEVAEPAQLDPLEIAYSQLPGEGEFTLLPPARDDRAREAVIGFSPGGSDRLNGSPRLTMDPAARCTGTAVDPDGRAVALVAKPGDAAIPLYPAAPLAKLQSGAVPLDVFLKSAGPGAPAARLKRVRQLLDARRFDEAVRLMLVLTVEEPRLIPDVAPDLEAASLEVAREALANGTAANCDALLTEVLARIPDAAEVWAAKGRGLAILGDLPNALACLRTGAGKDAVRRADFLAEAIGLLVDGAAQRKASGQVNDAIQLLMEQRRFFPESGEIRSTAGQLLMESKRFEEASQLFGEAALVDPKDATENRKKADRARDLAGGPGSIVVDYPPGESHVVVTARLNGSTTARLLLDSAESTSILPHGIVAAAGYAIPSLARVRFHADPLADEVPTVQIASLSIGGVTTGRVAAVVVDGYGAPYAEGVLGASFLSRFRRVEEASLGRLVLYPR